MNEERCERVAVIMAGGAGERFWPLSRCTRPKQLLDLTDSGSCLLAEAVGRIAPLVAPERIFIVTGRHLQDAIRQASLGIASENVIAEPCKRNTAGCLVYAAAAILSRLPSDPSRISMGVVTADHQISPADRFQETVRVAFEAAEDEDALVTIGIRPTRAETGYGHIEIPAALPETQAEGAAHPVCEVLSFREKPDIDTARRFLATGRFLWNSGMFFWRLSTFLTEMQHAAPEFAGAARDIQAALRASDQEAADCVFAGLPDISIDYALMERARSVLVVPGTFAWDDIGAWDALDRTFPHDEHGNIAVGDPILVDSENCIVYNASGAAGTAVAVVGMADTVVVTTEDAVAVVAKDRAQDVKAAVTELRRRESSQL